MTAIITDPPAAATASRFPLLRLVPLVGKHPMVFGLTVTSIVFHQVCSIGSVVAGAVIVGKVATGAGLAEIQGWLVALGLLVLGHAAGHWAEIWIAHDLAFRLLIHVRMRVYDGVERTAPGGLLDRRTGDLANGALSDAETLEWFYAHTVGNVIAAVLVPAGSLVVLGMVDVRLALVLLPALAVIAAAPFTLPARRPPRRAAQGAAGQVACRGYRRRAGTARAGRVRPRPLLCPAAGPARPGALRHPVALRAPHRAGSRGCGGCAGAGHRGGARAGRCAPGRGADLLRRLPAGHRARGLCVHPADRDQRPTADARPDPRRGDPNPHHRRGPA